MKKVLLATLCFGCGSSSSGESAAPKAAAIAQPYSDPALAPQLAKLDALLQEQLTVHQFPGLVAAVVTRDGIVWTKAYGVRDLETRAPMSLDTLFRLSSITKVFTALGVLQLRDRGVLDLDAPVSRWVPELADAVPVSHDSPPITLRHLMTHRSGLPREIQISDPYGLMHEISEAELLASLPTTRLDSTTGTTEAYSNLGAALEGLVIARASGRTYTAYMEDELLRPLGMPTATFDRDRISPAARTASYLRDKDGSMRPAPLFHEGATAARGQFYATIRELAQFASVELLAWPPREEVELGPVRRSTLRESQRTEGPCPPGSHTKGAGWFLEATSRGVIVEHSGGGEGFLSDIWLSPTS